MKILSQIFEGFNCTWQTFVPTLAIFMLSRLISDRSDPYTCGLQHM